ncbi:hypothetical protein C6A86_007925 [Mycobacterium sp. ITM-2016-00316]|uniref:three-helix bundle dimerization domain-containing protein n=1 Tax=Mycobacterium sp. ITM-2016-00316 TaxID=2099695 RepID=UPI000CF96350|nr:hypothetical protein [Mycobacterium sp. ITM-2016-00316]WNG83572.1 hypothetical protein C6A86_007925 [Mycobacterium sp. ITM-2016-00316]
MDRDELGEVIAEVQAKFPERPLEEVEDVVRGAYRHLARTATVTAHLIPLTLNRSMRLMRIQRDRHPADRPREFLVLAETSTYISG